MKVTTAADIVLKVPRYGTVPPPPDVIEAAKRLVAREGGVFKPNETIDPHSAEGEGADNASEWNSMLHTARAQRGPQWDVSSQLFHVDKESHLYYDSTSLQAAAAGEPTEPQQSGEHGEGGLGIPSQGATPGGHSNFNSPPPGSFGRRGTSQAATPNDYNSAYATNPATPSPAPRGLEIPPHSTRRITRGSSGRDMY